MKNNKAKGHCVWCERPLDRIGVCERCAKIIRAARRKIIVPRHALSTLGRSVGRVVC